MVIRTKDLLSGVSGRALPLKAYASFAHVQAELFENEQLYAFQKTRVLPVNYTDPSVINSQRDFSALKAQQSSGKIVTFHLYAVRTAQL